MPEVKMSPKNAFETYRRRLITGAISVLTGTATLGILFSVFKYSVSKQRYVPSKTRLKKIFSSKSDKNRRVNHIIEPIRNDDGHYEIKKSILPTDTSILLSLSGMPTIAVSNGSNIRVFCAKCSHLGCIVQWDPIQRRFKCPCHQGEYDENGAVIKGPPSKDLIEHQVIVTNSKVIISSNV
jgi:Rieske Fe-S protein